jgi:hypothetical protein
MVALMNDRQGNPRDRTSSEFGERTLRSDIYLIAKTKGCKLRIFRREKGFSQGDTAVRGGREEPNRRLNIVSDGVYANS